MQSRRGRAVVLRHAVPGCLALCLLVLLAPVSTATAASGDLAWQRIYNGTGDNADRFSAVAPAPNGGVYVAGATNGPGSDILVARYDAAGQRHWLRTYDGPMHAGDGAVAAATDRQGNLLAVGYANDANVAVIKYGPGGQRRWVRIFDNPTSAAEAAADVAIDGAGNIYVLGWRVAPASGYDIVLIKYSSSGARRWVRRYVGPGGADLPNDIAGDSAGNIYVTGQSVGTVTGYDAVTLKYDSAGHRRWVRRWDGSAHGDDAGWGIAVSGTGAVYVAGQATRTLSGSDALLLKYGGGGGLAWSRLRTSSGAAADSVDSYGDVVRMGNGDVVATGSSHGGPTIGSDVLIVRLSPAGKTRWAKIYDGPDNLSDDGYSVARGPAGEVFVMGAGYGVSTAGDILTLKYSGAGVYRWARRHSGDGAFADFGNALVVRSAGVYVAGSQGSASGDDAVLLKYRL